VTSDPFRPLFISASGRSGSTWVQDCLARANGCITLFEPLHEERVEGAAEFAFRYLHEDDVNPELEHGFQIFTSADRFRFQLAKYRRLFKDYRRYRGELAGPAVVKFIRAGLMVGWLRKTFQAPSMVLLRHPCAVVESKRRIPSWSSEFPLDRCYKDSRLREEALAGIALPDYPGLSPVSKFALHWCIETRVSLDQAGRCGIPLVFYERLVSEPDREWPRAAQALGLANTPDESLTRPPSQQSSDIGRDEPRAQTFLRKWETGLNQAERSEVRALLDLFEIPYYSVDDPLPVG
jgi:hypothetical protein